MQTLERTTCLPSGREFAAFFEIPEYGVDTPLIKDRKPYLVNITKRLRNLGYVVETPVPTNEYLLLIRWTPCDDGKKNEEGTTESKKQGREEGFAVHPERIHGSEREAIVTKKRSEACISLARARAEREGQDDGPLSI